MKLSRLIPVLFLLPLWLFGQTGATAVTKAQLTTALATKAAASSAATLSSNALALAPRVYLVKEASWSSATSNKTLTFASGATTAGNGITLDMTFADATAVIYPTAYRNGSGSTSVTTTYPAGHFRLTFTVRANGSTIDLNDDYATAANLPVVATPSNYTAATADTEAHLAGVDTALGLRATKTGTETLTNKIVLLTAAHASNNTYQGTAITGLNAGATIAQWGIVYLGSSSTWLVADANGTGTYPACGMAVASYVSTNAAVVIVRGTVRNDSWTWTPGGRLYMSTTAGSLTQTAPSTSGDKVQDVGFALTATIAYVDFSGVYLTVQ